MITRPIHHAFAFACALVCLPVFAATTPVKGVGTLLLFVDGSAVTLGDGSADRPFQTINEALSLAVAGRGDRVLVRNGVYAERVTLLDSVILRSDEGAFSTRINGSMDGQTVVTLGDGSILSGFSVGNAGNAAAVLIPDGNKATITNCVLHSSASGLMLNAGARATFLNNTVVNNSQFGVRGLTGATFSLLKNSIFAANTTAVSADASAIADASFNEFFANTTNYDGPAMDDSDFIANPGFVEGDKLNFHLRADSPARDAGDPDRRFDDVDESRNDLGADGGPFGVNDFEVPRILIDANLSTGIAPLTVNIDASASTDEWGIQDIVWDFDARDGFSVDASGPVATHTFTEAGEFVVTIKVTDHSGLMAFGRDIITVSTDANQPPRAIAQADPRAGVAPFDLQLTALGFDSEGGPLRYRWEFSDGSFSNEQNPLIRVGVDTPPGNYRGLLTVTDPEGAEALAVVFVTVVDEPEDESLTVDPLKETVLTIRDVENALDRASIVVPAGATLDPIVLTISRANEPLLRLPQDFGGIVKLGPTGHLFTAPVLVTLPHSPDTPHDEEIEVFWFDRATDAWRTDGVSNVRHIDAGDVHFVAFFVTHFTAFSTKSLVPRTILGSVTQSATGDPIDGATVRLEALSLETTTTSDGLYIFALDLDQGEYEISANAPGFEEETIIHFLSGNAVSALNFALDEGEGEGSGDGPGCGAWSEPGVHSGGTRVGDCVFMLALLALFGAARNKDRPGTDPRS